ncbi:MAG: MotA/TolQ/ExbB proton channel family protein [Gammaproteobacteria bacterium]|nr:MotA/TolQ/ExbB proton channel family protein [Gammaproteobacteria bacterium]
MFEIIKAGGWIMLPILACSVLALGILIERFWMLRNARVLPPKLVGQIWEWVRNDELDQTKIDAVYASSPLGRILAAGLNNRKHSREIMKESIEDTGRHVAHELERFIDSLGTIAAIAPLLGLLGTVLGMIKVFTVITTSGVGSPGELAGGISQALITTAAGLTVAIPALIFNRVFRAKVEGLVVGMEEESLKLVDVLHGERELEK